MASSDKMKLKRNPCNCKFFYLVTPDAIDSFRNGQISQKSSLENPFHATGHPPKVTYRNWIIVGIHNPMSSETSAPLRPIFHFNIKIQFNRTKIIVPTIADHVMILFFLCASKYLRMEK